MTGPRIASMYPTYELVLDQGRLIERGTHKELLALGGTYAKLYRQFIRRQ